MKFLARLATGQIALWRAFWLIGVPLAFVWDVSGICTAVGCGVQEPITAGFLLVLFTLSSAIIPFVSVAIWRSASKYPRQAWWHTVFAIGAKLCAAVRGLLATIGLLVVLYIAFIFIYAAIDSG
jgi:small-conductance mechanosensitive channel